MRYCPIRLSFAALSLALCFYLAGTVQYPVRRSLEVLPFPYQLDDEEGYVLGQALRLRAGLGLYPPIEEPPHVVDNYPPLYALVWSVLIQADSASLRGGRVLVFAGAIAAALAILTGVVLGISWRSPRGLAWLLERLTPACGLGLAFAVFFFTSRETLRWVGYARVDLPGLALSLWGLILFLLARGRWAVFLRWLAFACFLAAVFTKQSFVAAPVACLVGLALERRRTFLLYGGVFAGLGLLLFLLLCLFTGGRYYLHTVSYNRNVMHWGQISGWAVYLWRLYWPLVLAAGWTLVAAGTTVVPGWRKKQRRDDFFSADVAVLVYLLLNLFSLVSLAKAGSAENYVLEPIAALCLAAGYFFFRVQRDGLSIGKRAAWVRNTLLPGLLLLLLLVQASRYSLIVPGLFRNAPRPTAGLLSKGNRIVGLLRETPGPVLSEDVLYALRAGKDLEFQNFIMTQLAAEDKWDERGFVQRAKHREFGAIVSFQDLRDPGQYFNRWSPALRGAIAENYVLYQKLQPPPPARPRFLFLPRKEPPHAP